MNKRYLIIFGFFLIVVLYFFVFSTPSNFKEGTVVNIEKGSGLNLIAWKLKEAKVIRSTFVFRVFVVIYGGEKHLIPNNYLFENKDPVYTVARRIAKGDHGFGVAKITIPEGMNNIEIADKLSPELPYFNKETFLGLAKDKEGYLFPDTYFFTRDDVEGEVIKIMNDNFKKKIVEIQDKITASGRSEKDIITMASILEKEASGDEDRTVISGILWKRHKIGMALQADAAPITYEEKGLPTRPIGNPGLEAINAAINPVESPYLYYLHDKDGNIYYARSFEEHQANIAKYLK